MDLEECLFQKEWPYNANKNAAKSHRSLRCDSTIASDFVNSTFFILCDQFLIQLTFTVANYMIQSLCS